MRNCPVCNEAGRTKVFSTTYKTPDDWTIPSQIDWYTCNRCNMFYGDGEFTQADLNEYYRTRYGYGINSASVAERLCNIADEVAGQYPNSARFVDFGGGGDDGKSIACEQLKLHGWKHARNVNAGESVPECDVLLASHVIEHIYDLDDAMRQIVQALRGDGLLIVDGPDATGLVRQWRAPLLDFNTKHVNHFRTIDYLRLLDRYGFELVDSTRYVDVRSGFIAPSVRLYFRRFSTAYASKQWILENMEARVQRMHELGNMPVNVWGLGDISWHLLSIVRLNVIEFIDNDPAYRGATYGGKPVLERPTNNAPIVIMAQGQREKLIENIRKAGVTNDIIPI